MIAWRASEVMPHPWWENRGIAKRFQDAAKRGCADGRRRDDIFVPYKRHAK